MIKLRLTSIVAHLKIISGSWCLNHLVKPRLSQPAADVSSPPALWCEQEEVQRGGWGPGGLQRVGGAEVSFSLARSDCRWNSQA